MSAKTPLRGDFDSNGDLTGLSEFLASEFVDISDGGTGAVTAAGARTALGVSIGSNVQAYDAQLDDIAGLSVTDGGFIVGDGSNFVLETGDTARGSLGLATSDSPTFGGLTVTGNLTVQGTTTTLSTETITLDDNIILLNSNATGSATQDAGIEIERGDDANKTLIWDESNDYWSVGTESFVASTFIGNLTGNVTGTVSSLSGLDTGDLTEGSNLYFTDERVDDRVAALIIGGAGVDTAYDDAAGTLTLTADLSEITTDLNERIDDQVAALLVDSNTSGIDISYDDANGQLTISSDLSEVVEALQDNVQGLFVGGTGVTTAYDDASNALTLSIDFGEFDSDNIVEGSTNLFVTNERIDDRVNALLTDATTSGIDISYDDAGNALTLSVDLTEIVESLQDNVQGLFSGGTGITTTYDDAANTLSLSIDFSEFDTDNITEGSTNLFFTDERAQDAVGGMLSGNTETLITATYDDTNAKINLVVDNDLANYDNSTSGFITATLTQEQVEDFVGGMLDGTETLISVSYDDTDGNIDFVVDNDLANYSNTNSAFITLTSLSGGTGVTYNNGTGAISIGQAVGTTDNVQFNNLQVDGTLTSDDITSTNISVAGNATITGNLTVEGSTTTVDSTTVAVGDGMFKFAKDNIGNSTDVGFYGKIVQSSTTKYVGMHWDAGGINKFKLFDGLTVEPTGTVDTGDASYNTATLVANLEGNVTGNVTGTVSSIANFDTGDLSEGSNLYFTDARAIAALSAGTGITISGAGQIATTITQYANSDVESYLSGGTGIDFSSGVIEIDSTVVTESSTDTLTNKTVNLENNTVIVEYVVTVQSGNFLIDGEANATISFRPGVVHRFDLSSSTTSSHPFKLSITSDGSHNSGSEYTTGKTTNGSQGSSGAYVEYTVDAATPDILYYYCSSHSGMGGTITVFGSAYGDSDVQAYISAGSGISISGSGQISSTITQYADSDVQAYISAGSGISISGSGQISSTITQYADSDVQSYLSAGAGISISGSGQISSTITQYADSDVASYLSANNYATQSYVQTQVSNVIDAAPGALDTLNELAAAIGDDANFSTTITNSIATKLATADFTSTANTWLATKDTADLTEGTNLYFTNARADARIAAANLQDLSNVGFSAPGSSENNKVVFWDNSAGAFGLSSVSGLAGSGETNTASNIGTAGVGLFDGKVGEDLQFKKLNAGSAKITITDDTSNNEVDIDLGSVSVGDLSDVDITTSAPTNGQALVWNASNNEFEPGTVASSTNYFQNIAVSGQTTVAPDSTTDTLTFAAGSNITITTDASTDTVTIASTDTNTQLTQEQVEDFVNGVIVAGANITKTYDDAAGTLTIAATGGAANAFSTLAVSGQSNVVADAATDTLTLVAGTGMTLTTDASADSITFASTGGSAGSMPVTLSGGTSDPINLSSISTIGAIPFTSFDGSTDNIDLTGTSQTVTTFADNDGDTKLEVERSSDNDTVHIKAGGTDVLTATSSGVTISNLTVTGTSTQANEMKITDTLIELNADGTSLGVDAGIVIERGNTGADAAFIWDESSDSFAVGTLSTDGAILFTKADGTSQPLPISSNEVAFNHADNSADNLPISSSSLAFTDASGTSDPIAQVSYGPDVDMSVKITEATLKAKTQSQSDNSTKVATTAYVDTALGGVSSNSIKDADNDTKIEVENSDADEVVITTGGQERAKVDNNISMSARGGFFTHNLAMHASETFTIAATEGTVAAGPLDVQGTVDVQGSLVIL